MATAWIREYRGLAVDGNGVVVPLPVEPGRDQAPVTYTGTSAQSAAFGASTRLVEVYLSEAAHTQFGPNPTATTNDLPRGGEVSWWALVQPGDKVAFRTLA